MRRALILTLFFLVAGCKEAGTYTAEVRLPAFCPTLPVTRFQVSFHEGARCTSCTAPSGAPMKPAPACNAAAGCLQLCPAGGCPISELEGLSFRPDRPGSYAVYLEVFDAAGLQGRTCNEIVFHEDGTSSNPYLFEFVVDACCSTGCCRRAG